MSQGSNSNQKINPQGAAVPEEEKLEFLKREEIRTMQKDVIRLREGEAQTERERITELKPQEPRKEIPVRLPAKQEKRESGPIEKGMPVTLIPRELPKKLSPLQKIIVRAGVVLILLLFAGFFYWLIAQKPSEAPGEEETTLPEETAEEPGEQPGEQPEEQPEIKVPLSLISTEATRTLEIINLGETPLILSGLLKGKVEPQGFTRVLIENKNENKILGLKDFFAAFETQSPEGLLDKLNNDFTLFVYSTQAANRLGFVAKVEQTEGLLNLLKTWEGSMEGDTENLFASLGKETPAVSSAFKTAFHQGVGFRFLTISREDFGICYAWFDDYFVFTSSFESMYKAIEKIKSGESVLEIGQLLIVGFEGKTITAELKEIFRKYHPGGVLLLSKNIDNETQLKELTEGLQALSLKETGLPLLIAADQEGGVISRIGFAETKTPQSEIDDSDEAYEVGLIRGQEMKGLGINLVLAPVLDTTKEGDFLYERSFKKPATEAGELAKSLILGQNTAGILTALKHFPGYGDIAFNPEEKLAEKETVPEISQFKIAMAANPDFVMTSNVIYKNIDSSLPFTFSTEGIEFLKNNLGSDVLIISDDLAQDYLLEKFSLDELFQKSISAGVDLLIFSGWEADVKEALEVFFTSFQSGNFSKEKIEEAVSRIINFKQGML